MEPNRKEVTPAECIVFNHVHIPDTSGTVWLDWRILRHTNTAVDSQMQVSGTHDLLPLVIRVIMVLSGQREQSRPKHDVTEGIMTLA